MNQSFDLSLDKIHLSNLAASLQREWLCTGGNGCYASSTVAGCHTRKYHGLYVAPQPFLGQDNYVMLAQMQETVRQHGKAFHLGVTRYGDVYEPKGHKYLEKFTLGPHPCWWYRVGGVLLRKEILMHKRLNRLFIAYTLEEAHSPTAFELRPFFAFRRQ
ncbi:MAG: glycogen debranching enzyme N-terminal domain-containing protein, partial [Bacteroidales bacterium]|nr:glycogen debranching enzyme N-terminal domain-containing protein [Bacteroidales bacterium]